MRMMLGQSRWNTWGYVGKRLEPTFARLRQPESGRYVLGRNIANCSRDSTWLWGMPTMTRVPVLCDSTGTLQSLAQNYFSKRFPARLTEREFRFASSC